MPDTSHWLHTNHQLILTLLWFNDESNGSSSSPTFSCSDTRHNMLDFRILLLSLLSKLCKDSVEVINYIITQTDQTNRHIWVLIINNFSFPISKLITNSKKAAVALCFNLYSYITTVNMPIAFRIQCNIFHCSPQSAKMLHTPVKLWQGISGRPALNDLLRMPWDKSLKSYAPWRSVTPSLNISDCDTNVPVVSVQDSLLYEPVRYMYVI